jgi:hypothetical protein
MLKQKIDFGVLHKKFKKMYLELPVVLGNDAVNFSKERFMESRWVDRGSERWPARKEGAKRNKWRALLPLL